MNPIVSIIMGSDSDAEYLKPCADALREFNIPFEARVLSAHRTPVEVVEYVKNSEKNGVKIFICAAGGAAHLAGVVAAHTVQPVIGIPVESQFLHGLDSLLSTVQMPAGTPVATVGANSGGVKNAGYLAVRMLSLTDPALVQAMKDQKKKTAEKVLAKKVTL